MINNQNNNKNDNSSDDDIVSAITDTFNENKKMKSKLLGSSSNSTMDLADSASQIEKMKVESSNFQKIMNSLYKDNDQDETSTNKDSNFVTQKVLEMQDNEAELKEILHSNDIVSSVRNIMKENEKLKNDEKNLSAMLNQSTEVLDSTGRSKSNKEKIADLIQQNSELKKTTKTIQNLLPESTQINSSFNSHRNANSENKDSFSLNLKAYKDQISNLINENKQLKQEKKEVEQLIRPFQNEYDNE